MSIHFNVRDHVARVTIDRQDRMNAIDAQAEAELVSIWEAIEKDNDVRVVVLTGAGSRAFSTGADMKSGSTMSGLEYWAAPRPGGFGGIALRDTLNVPVIARVNGHALGGGMEMVLGCDIVIASEAATFGCPEPRVGRIAMTGGIALLTRRVAHVHAMGLLLSGKKIGAQDAFRIGLVNEVVAADDLDAAVDNWVSDILACAPLALKATKALARSAVTLRPKDAQMLRLPELVDALHSQDQDEGVKAFQEKRAPVWTGR
ncbi:MULTISPECIES: enoyl-CoA hydratase-related protein [Mesorhizobium]|uniref:enoyl-CoA hydratase-related protein n=1 Tax=Mesorhizobium TaxID=68287 RepID=UPI0010A95D6C|nr:MULTISPECIES: enoyl-CoA hydratase-related protein [Mesorhizobium]